VADGCGLGGSGEVDRLIRPGQVERLVRLGGEDLRCEGVVVGVPRVGQGLGEVPLGQSVLVAVVGDPAGQLGQLPARGGELPARFFLVAAGGEQPGDVIVKVGHDRAAELASAEPVIHLPVGMRQVADRVDVGVSDLASPGGGGGGCGRTGEPAQRGGGQRGGGEDRVDQESPALHVGPPKGG
jgi:hypothetical protein